MSLHWDRLQHVKRSMDALYELSGRPIQDSTVRIFWAGGVPVNVNTKCKSRYTHGDRLLNH